MIDESKELIGDINKTPEFNSYLAECTKLNISPLSVRGRALLNRMLNGLPVEETLTIWEVE